MTDSVNLSARSEEHSFIIGSIHEPKSKQFNYIRENKAFVNTLLEGNISELKFKGNVYPAGDGHPSLFGRNKFPFFHRFDRGMIECLVAGRLIHLDLPDSAIRKDLHL
jgi:hypothetical protein